MALVSSSGDSKARNGPTPVDPRMETCPTRARVKTRGRQAEENSKNLKLPWRVPLHKVFLCQWKHRRLHLQFSFLRTTGSRSFLGTRQSRRLDLDYLNSYYLRKLLEMQCIVNYSSTYNDNVNFDLDIRHPCHKCEHRGLCKLIMVHTQNTHKICPNALAR